MVLANLMPNSSMAQKVIADAVSRLPVSRECECVDALASAIITRPEAIPSQVRRQLAPIISKYVT